MIIQKIAVSFVNFKFKAMKTTLKLTLLFFVLSFFSFNNKVISADSIKKEINIVKQIENEEMDNALHSLFCHKNLKLIKRYCCNKHCAVKTLPLSNKLLVLSPLFTIGLIFLILCIILKRSGFSLTQALSTKRTNEQGQPEFLASSSKLLAFISILLGIILVAFFFTFYFFLTFKQLPLPNFIGLWPIVFLIGLGLLPYIIQTIFKK